MIKVPARYPELADPQSRPRFSGIPTFFRTPYEEDLTRVDIGVIGVPFDGGVTNRTGTRHGPRAVRTSRRCCAGINPRPARAVRSVACRDLGDCWIEQPFELEGALAEIAAVFRTVCEAGVMPLSVGGDHSIILPILRAVAAGGPVGMVHIDAHCDTGDDYLGSRFHHGAPFRRATEEGLLDPKRVIQIGIRGTHQCPDMWGVQPYGMRVLPMEEFHDKGWACAARGGAARRRRAGRPIFSFDIDSLDPSGAGHRDARGRRHHHARGAAPLRALDGLDFVGGDLVEVSPPFDVGGLTTMSGVTILFEMLCVLARSRVRRAAAP